MIWYHRRCDEPDEKPFELSIRSWLLGLATGVLIPIAVMQKLEDNQEKKNPSKEKKERIEEEKGRRIGEMGVSKTFRASSRIKLVNKKELDMAESKKLLSPISN